MSMTDNIDQVLKKIRSLTPNHPQYKIEKEQTFTQKPTTGSIVSPCFLRMPTMNMQSNHLPLL